MIPTPSERWFVVLGNQTSLALMWVFAVDWLTHLTVPHAVYGVLILLMLIAVIGSTLTAPYPEHAHDN